MSQAIYDNNESRLCAYLMFGGGGVLIIADGEPEITSHTNFLWLQGTR